MRLGFVSIIGLILMVVAVMFALFIFGTSFSVYSGGHWYTGGFTDDVKIGALIFVFISSLILFAGLMRDGHFRAMTPLPIAERIDTGERSPIGWAYCPNCGFKTGGMGFCPRCGIKLN